MKYLLTVLLLGSISASEWGESTGRGCLHLLRRERVYETRPVRSEVVLAETVVLPEKSISPDVVVGTSKNYKTEVEDCEGPVLVEFSARWCSSCADIAPLMSALATDYKHGLKVVLVDVDDSPELAQQAHVNHLPMLEIIKKGTATVSRTGRISRDELHRWIGEHVGSVREKVVQLIQPIFSEADPLPKIVDIFHRPRAEILIDPVPPAPPVILKNIDEPTSEQKQLMQEFHLATPPTILNADGTVRAGAKTHPGATMIIPLPATKNTVSTASDRIALSQKIIKHAMECVECVAGLTTFEQEAALEMARSVLACDARRLETLQAIGMQDQISQLFSGAPQTSGASASATPKWVQDIIQENDDGEDEKKYLARSRACGETIYDSAPNSMRQ